MRVLMVVEGFNAVGGIAEIADNLAAELNGAGHTAAILSTRDVQAARSGYERHPQPGVECIYDEIWNRKPLGLRHLETLVRIPWHARFGGLAHAVRLWHPDVVNSHLWVWDRYPTVISACRCAGVPMIQSFHVTDERGRGRLGERGLRALEHAAAIIAGSAATRDFFGARLPAARNAHVIIGGVDGPAAARATPYFRSRPYLLCACRLHLEHKALDVLIAAFRTIAREFPLVDLLIAGGGPDFERVASFVNESGCADRIELMGVKTPDELRSLQRGALAFILPSRPGECMPLVYLEGLAAGTPVIGTDTGGAREVIRNGENGFLLPPGDVDGTASAIRILLSDTAMRTSMGSRGQRLVSENYTWTKCASNYVEVYNSCLRSSMV
ncbi:MAG TPA: glycosyltransferase family 4 protein [Candidatus Binataceae bacterium]|nr:glycosyltransferase family 4 protein [Candidatus Binataceae bacterium]